MGAVVSGFVQNSTMTVGARTGSSALFTLQIEGDDKQESLPGIASRCVCALLVVKKAQSKPAPRNLNAEKMRET